MNYVLAKTTAELLKEPGLIVPYVENGFERIGKTLEGQLWQGDDGYAGDRKGVDDWANTLELSSWYRWTRLP